MKHIYEELKKHDKAAKDKNRNDSSPEPGTEEEVPAGTDEFADIAQEETFFTGESPGALDHPSIKALEEKLTAAEELAHKNWDAATRAMAELANFRTRSERDLDSTRKYAIQRFVEELLPIIDSLEQAMTLQVAEDQASALEKMRHGIELTLKLFVDVLQKFSVKVVDPLNQMFDPHIHEAVSMQESSEVPPGTILAVFQKGYLLNERTIRPARVVVAKAPAE